MVEYTRLLGGDWADRFVGAVRQGDPVVLAGIAAATLVVGYFLARRR